MFGRMTRCVGKDARRLGARETAAAASEYAVLLAAAVISVLVGATMLSRGLSGRLATLGAVFAQATNGDAAGAAASRSGNNGGEGGGKGSKASGKGNGGKAHGKGSKGGKGHGKGKKSGKGGKGRG